MEFSLILECIDTMVSSRLPIYEIKAFIAAHHEQVVALEREFEELRKKYTGLNPEAEYPHDPTS